MKILITGIAGFIAFNFAKELCNNKNIKVVGIDNYSDYYSVKLKKKRVQILRGLKNFKFIKVDLVEKKKLIKFLNIINLMKCTILQLKQVFVTQWKTLPYILIQMLMVLVIL